MVVILTGGGGKGGFEVGNSGEELLDESFNTMEGSGGCGKGVI